MLRGLYSTAGALQMAERNHEVIANNLANATMPGFRRQLVAFESLLGAPAGNSGSIGSPNPRPVTVFEPGNLEFTDRALDVGLKGDAFFVVEGPKGPLYTRNGAFEIDGQGTLRNGAGMAVSGTSGPITIPPGTLRIVIRPDGVVVADNNEVGSLKLTSFTAREKLEQAGTTLYEAPPAAGAGDATNTTVHQGYRETSNVQIVDELVRMIAGMRMYEASQRALKSISDAIEQRSNGLLQ